MAAAALLALSAAATALEVGDTAPPLQAAQGDGTIVALEALRGQVVYVDFWASWCAPCREALPALDGLYRRYRERGFTVLAVNVDTERAAADRMLSRMSLSFPIVYDPQGTWPEAFALRGMPSGYLLDRDGVVRFVKAGYTSRDLPQLDAAIAAETAD